MNNKGDEMTKYKTEKITQDLWYYSINNILFTIQKNKKDYIVRNSGNIISYCNNLSEAKKACLKEYALR